MIALWSIAVCTGLFFVLAAFRTSDQENCTSISVTITGTQGDRFVSEDEVRKTVTDAGVKENMPVAGINIRMLEEKLERNPWIKNAEIYIDKKKALNIQVYENIPVLRVFDIKENSYYLDAAGTVMPPANGYTAKLPVFTGWNPADSAFTGQVLALAAFISNNDYWKAQVQQVEITKDRMFTLAPSLGDQVVFFGDTTLMEDKFNRLYQYFTKVAPKTGFNRFESLNVQYAGQLVAINKNASGVAIDSNSAKRLIRNLIEQGSQPLTDSGRIVNITAQTDTLLRVNTPPVVNNPVAPPRTNTPPKPAVNVAAPRNVNRGTRVTVPPKPKPKPKPPVRQPRAVMGRGN